ncbi:MAG: hypothetical protein UHD09_06285 [Bifidobacterium sp.]|nr:hypothetical protein [Bifidobacterium sp.]
MEACLELGISNLEVVVLPRPQLREQLTARAAARVLAVRANGEVILRFPRLFMLARKPRA